MENSDQIQEKLCEISWMIIEKLDDPNITLSKEEKETLHLSNDTMMFFIEQENWERALTEGQNTLNKLKQITEF
jgi:prephenate dehydratase|tara:strand:+ start:196 stop:417 length:222 start_codon:yes stop_codon:yes gene_type:complete